MQVLTKSIRIIDYENNRVYSRITPDTFDEYISELISHINSNDSVPPQRESIKDYRRITCEKGKYLAKQPQILRNEPTSSQKTMNQTVKTMHRIALVFAMESCMKNA